jgi:hypothetical protein
MVAPHIKTSGQEIDPHTELAHLQYVVCGLLRLRWTDKIVSQATPCPARAVMCSGQRHGETRTVLSANETLSNASTWIRGRI